MPYIGSPVASSALRSAVASRTLRRLVRTAAALAGRRDPRLALLAALVASLRARGGDRSRAEALLFGSALRALASSLEQAVRILTGARQARERPPGLQRDRALAALFDEVAATPHLRETAPRQVADPAFALRAGRLGRRILDEALDDLPALAAPHVTASLPRERFRLVPREDAEQARAAGEHPLGGTALLLVIPDGTRATIEIAARTWVVRRGDRVLLEAEKHVMRPAGARGARVVARPLLPGSPSLRMSRRLVSRARSLRVGGHVPGLGARLAPALALLRDAWKEAHDEVHLFTELLVPLDEPGTVSYSLPARPGVSYVNVWRKSLLQLADDVLHETAHHKLHAVEELEPLVDDDGAPIWWSPWRRAWRPLRGIVHACYTFAYGGLLFARLAERPELLTPARLRFARRRLLEEEASLAFSAHDLGRAARRRALAPAGDEIRREIDRLLADVLSPASRSAEEALREGDDARTVADIARLRRSLGAMRGVRPGRG